MNISIELTLLPLNDNFEDSIKNFIKKLRTLGFKVLENPMSTQIYGEYDAVMSALQKAIKESFENEPSVVLNMKIIKGDRSGYVSVFDFLFGQYSAYTTIDIVLEITGVLFDCSVFGMPKKQYLGLSQRNDFHLRLCLFVIQMGLIG